MNTREYVDKLFDNYADTPELSDFKLEITANLDDRVADLQKSGFPPEEAFTKAVSELGNITEIADEISKQKRNEVIDRMYVHQKISLTPKRALSYVIAGGILIFGIIITLMIYFQNETSGSERMVGFASVPFVTASAFIFTYLGLTQETAANFPMKRARAIWYSIAVSISAFGIVTAVSSAVSAMSGFRDFGIIAALGILIPFLIPSAGWLAFLVLTEKPRHKPWVIEQNNKYMAEYAEKFTGKNAEKFGIGSGILWTLSIAVFITLGVIFGFQYSWLVFLFSIVGEMVLLYNMFNKN